MWTSVSTCSLVCCVVWVNPQLADRQRDAIRTFLVALLSPCMVERDGHTEE